MTKTKYITWKDIAAVSAISLVFFGFILPVVRSRGERDGILTFSSLSQLKQLGTSHGIYLSVYDERSLLLARTQGASWVPWPKNMFPYIKTKPCFFAARSYPNYLSEAVPLMYTEVGLNHCALNRTDGNKHMPVAVPSLAHPERLILFSWRPRYTGEEAVLRYAPTGMPYLGNIEAPVRDPKNEVCVGSWGTDFWVQRRVVSKSEPAASTGLVAVTVPGFQTETPYTVCFVDGHAGKVTLTQLTAGTDCQVHDDWVLAPCRITDPTKYLWGEPTP